MSTGETCLFFSFPPPPIHDSDILESVTINEYSKPLYVWIGLNLEKLKAEQKHP